MSNPSKFILACTALVISVVILVHAQSGIDGQSIVATVNGEPVTFNEFKQSLADNRAKVFGYFKGKYNADDSKHFWTTNFNGELPLDTIKKDALANSVRIKVQQTLAKQKGIVADITYDKFLENLDTENKQRAKAVKNNQVVYGPEHYNESAYYSLVNSNMIDNLKKTFLKDMTFPDEKLRQYYETNKDELFKYRDALKIEKISVTKPSSHNLTSTDAEQVMDMIKKNIDDGMDIESAAANYKEQVSIQEQLLDSQSAHKDALASPILMSKANSLIPGQTTDVFKENGAYFIAKCMERTIGGYQPFEDVKKGIEINLSYEAYDQMVDNLIHHAKVVINSKVYNRIGVENVE